MLCILIKKYQTCPDALWKDLWLCAQAQEWLDGLQIKTTRWSPEEYQNNNRQTQIYIKIS